MTKTRRLPTLVTLVAAAFGSNLRTASSNPVTQTVALSRIGESPIKLHGKVMPRCEGELTGIPSLDDVEIVVAKGKATVAGSPWNLLTRKGFRQIAKPEENKRQVFFTLPDDTSKAVILTIVAPRMSNMTCGHVVIYKVDAQK